MLFTLFLILEEGRLFRLWFGSDWWMRRLSDHELGWQWVLAQNLQVSRIVSQIICRQRLLVSWVIHLNKRLPFTPVAEDWELFLSRHFALRWLLEFLLVTLVSRLRLIKEYINGLVRIIHLVHFLLLCLSCQFISDPLHLLSLSNESMKMILFLSFWDELS